MRTLFFFCLLFSFFTQGQTETNLDEIKNTILEEIAVCDTLINERDYETALDKLTQLQFKCEKHGLATEKARILLKIGDVYYNLEDLVSSTKYTTNALLVPNALSDHDKIQAYNKLGVNHSMIDDTKKSIEAYRNAIALIPSGKKSTQYEYEWIYNNIALALVQDNSIDSARFYHEKCLEIRKSQKNNNGLGQTYNNLGTLNFHIAQYDSALFYFKLGLEYRTKPEQPSETALIESEINIGKALIALNRLDEAEAILQKQTQLTVAKSYIVLEQRAAEQLTILYKRKNNFSKAIHFMERYYAINDSLYSTEKRDEIIRLNELKKYSEKAMRDSLNAVEQLRIQEMEYEKRKLVQDAKSRNAFYIQLGLIVVVVLLAITILSVYRNYRNNQKSSQLILEQKHQVEEQKDRLANANQEIMDSINYAQRIQTAILPSRNIINNNLINPILFYQPKAVVAGDFYWTEKRGDTVYFAAADCTGHGVPGALVSVICSNALQQSIDAYNCTDPKSILERTDQLVTDILTKNEDTVTDGMDIALCALNRKEGTLSYTGANNPLYILRKQKDSYEIEEIKASKKPIGFCERIQGFELHSVAVQPGDLIYTFTDGFADQFGGERGKKYKYGPFKQFLQSIAAYSPKEQELAIEQEFIKWKGKEDQVDDICILGVII